MERSWNTPTDRIFSLQENVKKKTSPHSSHTQPRQLLSRSISLSTKKACNEKKKIAFSKTLKIKSYTTRERAIPCDGRTRLARAFYTAGVVNETVVGRLDMKMPRKGYLLTGRAFECLSKGPTDILFNLKAAKDVFIKYVCICMYRNKGVFTVFTTCPIELVMFCQCGLTPIQLMVTTSLPQVILSLFLHTHTHTRWTKRLKRIVARLFRII